MDGLEHTQQQNRARCRPYTITREYRFYGSGQQEPKSEVMAEVRFVPPNEKTFTIDRYEGSARGQKIVQHILEGEAQAARKDPPALDRRSYEFTLLGEDQVQGRPSWVLGLKPRREEQQLVQGKAWVDKESYQIHRVDGDMARAPSWWLKKIHVTLEYGGVDGVWVPVETRAVVDVRLFGTHIVTAQAVRIQAGIENAGAALAEPGSIRSEYRPRHRIPSVVGSSVFTTR